MSSDVQLFDAAGRRRSPATLPDFHAGRAPANKGQRYAADPPTVDEIIAIMRVARNAPYGNRLNGLIVVLWRAGLRINEAVSLIETDLEQRRGSILVRHGKNDRRRVVGMDAWGWAALESWVAERLTLPVGPLFCVVAGPTRGPRVVGQRRSPGASSHCARGGCPPARSPAPAPPCARCRAAARGDRAAADPAPAGALAPLDDRVGVGPGCGAGVAAGPFPRPALRTGHAHS